MTAPRIFSRDCPSISRSFWLTPESRLEQRAQYWNGAATGEIVAIWRTTLTQTPCCNICNAFMTQNHAAWRPNISPAGTLWLPESVANARAVPSVLLTTKSPRHIPAAIWLSRGCAFRSAAATRFIAPPETMLICVENSAQRENIVLHPAAFVGHLAAIRWIVLDHKIYGKAEALLTRKMVWKNTTSGHLNWAEEISERLTLP